MLHWTPRVRTFLGTHPESGEPVSVKIIAIGSQAGVAGYGRLFLDRCEVLRGLDHPSLPRLIEAGLTGSGDAFLVFEWIEARLLSQVMPLEPEAALPVLGTVLEGLECLALHNLVHWNVSPDTVLIDDEGRTRLVGLGISLLPLDWWSSHREPLDTSTRYLAPEFRSVVHSPTAALGGAWWKADLYSAAVVTCEALGARIVDEGSAAPRVELPAGLGEDVRQTLESCLRADPRERPVSFAQVIRVFRDAAPRSDSGGWARPKLPAPSESGELQIDSDEELEKTQVVARMSEDDYSALQGVIEDRIAGGDTVGDEATEALRLLGHLPDLDDTDRLEATVSIAGGSDPSSAPEVQEHTGIDLRDDLDSAADDAAELGETRKVDLRGKDLPAAVETRRGDPAPVSAPSAASEPANGEAGSEAAPPPPPPPKIRSGTSESDDSGELRGQLVPPDLMETQPLPVLEVDPEPQRRRADRSARAKSGAPPTGTAAVEAARPASSSVPRLALPTWLTDIPARRQSLALGSVAAVIVMLAVALWPRERPPVPAESVVESPVPPPSSEPLVSEQPEEPPPLTLPPELERVFEFYADGDLVAARRALDDWLEDRTDPLSDALCDVVVPLGEAIDRQRAEELEQSLRIALTQGDAERLRSELRGMTTSERVLIESQPPSAALLGRALEVGAALDRYERELGDGEFLDALDRAQELAARYPAFDRSLRLRERAALGVERAVDGFLDNGRFEAGRQALQALRERWPERGGQDERLRRIEQGLQSRARYEQLLQQAKATLDSRPHEGLELLSGVQPPYPLVSEFASLEERLRERFAELDRQPPEIELADELPEVRKGDPVTVEVRVSDDYGVDRVVFWLSAADSENWQEHRPERGENGVYRLEIAPSLHGDRPIDLWIEAFDLSGHGTSVGSAEEPLELRRRRWFRFGG